jgi:nicotinate-nucleotide adenylyltransferase
VVRHRESSRLRYSSGGQAGGQEDGYDDGAGRRHNRSALGGTAGGTRAPQGMNATQRLGVLGGTFDPIHYGHLRAGEAAEELLELDEIRVIPSHDPPHRARDPRASAFHRFALVALAVEGRERWRLSDAELTRSGPSYTAPTLRALHAEGWQPSQIFFIIGTDAFAEIATWYDYPSVLDLANFAVVTRAGTPPTSVQHASVSYVNVKTPEVSSTEIRARLAAGQSISDLVPPAVERYILNHRLYVSSAPEPSA